MPAADPDASRRDVDARLAALAHPLAPAVDVIRDAVRSACPDAVESWKWNAPSWSLGDHFATLALRKPDEVLLVLHAGARTAPDRPAIEVADPAGLLRAAGPHRAIAKFRDAAEVRDARPALDAVVRAWVAQLDPS
ncbi:DUF1801 domain-containing protein [Clavibacter zhangzhiyongii]|uniref:DUF1801 domain-containing protein n=1 Tax=Clavibacter zhangzhiyongii TaxID=2768071 RepID=A0A7L7Z389_9MICO|nr:DUF1801 domain-containing protein [Clavibacter zhangzhiyongii]QOD44176.1 DUF1801 domain-containing protein [Clavibacter zhangzhiyongii]